MTNVPNRPLRINAPIRPNQPTNAGNAPVTAPTEPNIQANQPQVLQTNDPRDLDRRRASAAWANIQTVKSLNFQAKYGSLARKMPTLIQVNGLGQTLAFLRAKANGDDRHARMFNHISQWVCGRLGNGTENLLNRVLNMDSQTYRLATSETLAFLQWIKRFAEAELGEEE